MGEASETGEHTLQISSGKGMEVFRRVQAPLRDHSSQLFKMRACTPQRLFAHHHKLEFFTDSQMFDQTGRCLDKCGLPFGRIDSPHQTHHNGIVVCSPEFPPLTWIDLIWVKNIKIQP